MYLALKPHKLTFPEPPPVSLAGSRASSAGPTTTSAADYSLGMSKIARTLVSKKKRRYQQDGFDLDLTYIVSARLAAGLDFFRGRNATSAGAHRSRVFDADGQVDRDGYSVRGDGGSVSEPDERSHPLLRHKASQRCKGSKRTSPSSALSDERTSDPSGTSHCLRRSVICASRIRASTILIYFRVRWRHFHLPTTTVLRLR
eukprot:COSAG02_NODE_581_length_20056_cov_9.304906_15_plen_201_part_00